MESKPVRKEPRIQAVLPVRIYGMTTEGKPFNSVAHTLNVSKSGALLGNVDVNLNVGDVIGVQKGVYKGKFRIQWVGKKGSSAQGQVGVECTEGAKNIWGLEAAPYSMVRERDSAGRRAFAGMGFERERRAAVRHRCDIGVQIQQGDSGVKLWGRCTDISEGGCYIDSRSPAEVNAKFQLTLFLEGESLVAPAVVRTSFPNMGMGVQFEFQQEDQAVILRRYLREKFAGTVGSRPAEAVTGRFRELEKLSECLEQLRVWTETAQLDASGREDVEEFAISVRREMQGLRAELESHILSRSSSREKTIA